MKAGKIMAIVLSCVLAASAFAGCAAKKSDGGVPKTKWVATWGSGMRKDFTDQLPKQNSFAGSTVRQQIRTTVSGDVMRLTFSNQYGESDLVIESVHIAKLKDPTSSEIKTKTDTVVTFGGSESITIPAGETAVSDDIAFSFEALEDIAVTTYFSDVPSTITGHTASRCYIWTKSGNHVDEKELTDAEITSAWYFLARIDTLATEDTKIIVTFGDSLTDGASVTDNIFSRWPDELARQLKANEQLCNYGVINMGNGGTLLRWDMARFERDVLNTPGVDTLVVLYGINDLSGKTEDISQNIIGYYEEIIEKCHENGIKVYFGTLTPTKGNTGSHYSKLINEMRHTINDWIMTNDQADGYIDFASAVASVADKDMMDEAYVSKWKDWLHFNDNGYTKLGQTAYDVLKDELK